MLGECIDLGKRVGRACCPVAIECADSYEAAPQTQDKKTWPNENIFGFSRTLVLIRWRSQECSAGCQTQPAGCRRSPSRRPPSPVQGASIYESTKKPIFLCAFANFARGNLHSPAPLIADDPASHLFEPASHPFAPASNPFILTIKSFSRKVRKDAKFFRTKKLLFFRVKRDHHAIAMTVSNSVLC